MFRRSSGRVVTLWIIGAVAIHAFPVNAGKPGLTPRGGSQHQQSQVVDRRVSTPNFQQIDRPFAGNYGEHGPKPSEEFRIKQPQVSMMPHFQSGQVMKKPSHPSTPPINPNPPVHSHPQPAPGHEGHCGNHVWWKVPCSWWYPAPRYCVEVCRPVCPVVQPIYEVTLLDAVPIMVTETPRIDLALKSIGFVDAGDLAANLGPRYRMTIVNGGSAAAGEFQVLFMAGMEKEPKAGLPSTLVKIEGLSPGEARTFDVRLPAEALSLGRADSGEPLPFEVLFTAIDSHEQIDDVDRSNNGAILLRKEIPAVAF